LSTTEIDTRPDTASDPGVDSPPEPQHWPLNARFADDFVTQLVLVLSTDTMDEVADKVAHHVVGKRLPDRGLPKVVIHNGKIIPADTIILASGKPPLAAVYVEWSDTVAGAGR
jgi:toluene monooxygenase system protein B